MMLPETNSDDIHITLGQLSHKGHAVQEIWPGIGQVFARPIPGFPDYYMGTNGVCYSIKTGTVKPLVRALNTKKTYYGYRIVDSTGKVKTLDAHRLMAITYMCPRPEGMTISHINGDSSNNTILNLQWETYSENVARKVEHGTDDRGIKNSRSKFSEKDIKDIRERLARGEKVTAIAREYGVKHPTISRIKNGKRY